MVKNIIENEKYKNLVSTQINEIIMYLLNENIEFSITANLAAIDFEPELPKVIKDKLSRFSLFTLSNYTYSTIKINEEIISFEAGFGSENFGSVVKVPLYAIFQIIVDESILYLNPVATVDKFMEKRRDSFSVFKNNPKNIRFK